MFFLRSYYGRKNVQRPLMISLSTFIKHVHLKLRLEPNKNMEFMPSIVDFPKLYIAS